MNYNRKIMRLELSAEKALNGGYYYAELLLPAADYEIKDAMQKDSCRRQRKHGGSEHPRMRYPAGAAGHPLGHFQLG